VIQEPGDRRDEIEPASLLAVAHRNRTRQGLVGYGY